LVELICAAAGVEIGEIVEIHERTPTVEAPGLLRRPRKLIIDLVLTVHGKKMKITLIVIIEVQLSWDRTKARHWALAPVAFAAAADADAVVAVFTPDGRLRQRIRRRLLPKIMPRPTLIEPDQVRLITDEAEAREHMFEAVLGAIYHGGERSPVEQRVAGIRAAYLAIQRLEFRHYFRYAVLMSSMVPPELFSQAIEQLRARGVLEEDRPERLTDIERRSWLYHSVRERGIAAGLEQGRQAGLEQGRQQGLQALQRALVDVLELRGFALSAASRARIEACEQFEMLERWYARARAVDPSTPLADVLE
jgi:rRNA-processing protein FCF1